MAENKLKTNIIKATTGCLVAGPLLANSLYQFASGNPEVGFISAVPTIVASVVASSGFRGIVEEKEAKKSSTIEM